MFWRRPVARRPAEQMSVAGGILEQISSFGEGTLPLDERLGALARLRESGIENSAVIDRFLMEQIGGMHEALSTVEEQHGHLRSLIRELTAPPYFPAVFLGNANTPEVQGALVQSENERRVVQLGEGVVADELQPGDEVFLSHERNVIVAKSNIVTLLTGEVAKFERALPDGRLVIRLHDEEIVVQPKASLRDAGLKAGDGVRFNRAAGLALEKIETSKGDQFFLEVTPKETFADVGGLDAQLDSARQMLTLHKLHPELVMKYRLPRKTSIIMVGPPGNGKTLLARAIGNWMARESPSGRSHFINIKPGGLSSMWYGATENNFREVFRVARELAAAEPDVAVILFFDEIDSIGSNRGESINRIDDKVLNCFMAELNGLEERGNILILSATNRMDSIDPALLRPGRLGDLVLHFPQPGSKASRAILARHLPMDIPYATDGESHAAAREALLDQAVAELFAHTSDTELANLTFRDGKQRMVRAADLVSGAQLQSIARAAQERACVRESQGGPAGITSADMHAAISDFFISAPSALTPRNVRYYLNDLPQDVDVVRVELVDRKVKRPHLYRVEAA